MCWFPFLDVAGSMDDTYDLELIRDVVCVADLGGFVSLCRVIVKTGRNNTITHDS